MKNEDLYQLLQSEMDQSCNHDLLDLPDMGRAIPWSMPIREEGWQRVTFGRSHKLSMLK